MSRPQYLVLLRPDSRRTTSDQHSFDLMHRACNFFSAMRCTSCGRKHTRTSPCEDCINRQSQSDMALTNRSDSGRYNSSGRCIISLDALHHPFAKGNFRYAAKGKFGSGPRKDQPCVVKWFKARFADCEDTYYSEDIRAVDRALEIINVFNDLHPNLHNIKLNIPEVWAGIGYEEFAGRKFLVEPYIENFEKFNSNNGWNDDCTECGKLMQALSHFSYHWSKGSYVLVDIQGGIYADRMILTDPCILSRNRTYGMTDLGSKGIRQFFKDHRCNKYCDPRWDLPCLPRTEYFPRIRGTTMLIRRPAPQYIEAPRVVYYARR